MRCPVLPPGADTFAMAKLIFSAIASLDGYIEDEGGNFDWGAPDDEVLGFLNELERPIGTYLYGRRMYETMVYWETAEVLRDQSPMDWDWMQIWRSAEKVVYSSSLEAVSSSKTRIERNFDAIAIRAMKDSLDRDISIGGPELAAQAFRAGLIDDCQLFLMPVLIGGGKPALPRSVRLDLDLVHERCFGNGVVFLHYRLR